VNWRHKKPKKRSTGRAFVEVCHRHIGRAGLPAAVSVLQGASSARSSYQRAEPPAVQFEREASRAAASAAGQFGKEGNPEAVIAKPSQETLAEMIGTTRSRVNFFMNKFRKLGFIEHNGVIKIHSSLLNVVLHDQSQNISQDAET